jgi:hypothetical protein
MVFWDVASVVWKIGTIILPGAAGFTHIPSTQKVYAASSSKTMVIIYHTTRHYIQDNHNVILCHCWQPTRPFHVSNKTVPPLKLCISLCSDACSVFSKGPKAQVVTFLNTTPEHPSCMKLVV